VPLSPPLLNVGLQDVLRPTEGRPEDRKKETGGAVKDVYTAIVPPRDTREIRVDKPVLKTACVLCKAHSFTWAAFLRLALLQHV
jgi:hypothetical protein